MNDRGKDNTLSKLIIPEGSPDLKVIEGGKTAPIMPSFDNSLDNWLLKLKEETKFICKKKKTAPLTSPIEIFACHEFELVVKRFFEDTWEWGVLLNTGVGKQSEELWVDPFRFVSQYDLVGKIYER